VIATLQLGVLLSKSGDPPLQNSVAKLIDLDELVSAHTHR
jgi:hypothetical protein